MTARRLVLAAAVALAATTFTGTASAACGPRTLIVCAVRHHACQTVEPHVPDAPGCGVQS